MTIEKQGYQKPYTMRQGHMKDYDKRTGSIKGDRFTTLRHIIAHIENGKEFFGIKSAWWNGPMGFEYDDRFPSFVNRIVRNIDMKYGVAQDSSFHFVEAYEPDWATDDDWSGTWPVWDRDSGSVFDNPRITVETLADEERQIWSWMSNMAYMLHDSFVSYLHSLGEGTYDKPSRMIRGDDDTLRMIAFDLYTWKAEWKAEEQKYWHKMQEPKAIEHDDEHYPTVIEWEDKVWEISNE